MKLDHILTMRNEVAASHPNVAHIGGYELLGWLQTCVKDVLRDRPSESSIRIRSLVDNLKSQKDVVDAGTLSRVKAELNNLSLPHVNNLLISIFGMFVAPASDQVLRKNVAQIAPAVWQYSEEKVKYRIGTMADGYRTNLQQDKLQLSVEFLRLVDGLRYETLPARSVGLDKLADKLLEVHQNWDNFYNEPPVVEEILSFCKSSTDIPDDVMPKLTKVVVRCRLGRGVTFCDGVSPAGGPMYDRFLGLLDDKGIIQGIVSLADPELNAKIQHPIRQKHLRTILEIFKSRAISERLKEALQYLLADISEAHKAFVKREFKDILRPLVTPA